MSVPDFDPDAFGAIDEMLTSASDYSLAGLLVRNTSEAKLTQILADEIAKTRAVIEWLRGRAFVYGRFEEAAELVADLEDLAARLEATIPDEVTVGGEDER